MTLMFKRVAAVLGLAIMMTACQPAQPALSQDDADECRRELPKEAAGTAGPKDQAHLAMCRQKDPKQFPQAVPK